MQVRVAVVGAGSIRARLHRTSTSDKFWRGYVLPLLHIKLLRAVQPEGPYLLVSFCNGGLVAYEMALRHYAEGQTVELLVFSQFDGVFASMPE